MSREGYMPKNEQMTKWKNSRCILKMLFFHCHVSFREGCVIARPNPDSALKEKALEMNYQRMKKNYRELIYPTNGKRKHIFKLEKAYVF